MHLRIPRLAGHHDRPGEPGADLEAHAIAVARALVALRLLDGHATRHEPAAVSLELRRLAPHELLDVRLSLRVAERHRDGRLHGEIGQHPLCHRGPAARRGADRRWAATPTRWAGSGESVRNGGTGKPTL